MITYVGIWIREQTGLKNGVCGWLDTRDEMRRAEGDLLDFCKVILRILVQYEPTDLFKRELLLRPNVSQVEDVNLLFLPEFLGFPRCHGLDK